MTGKHKGILILAMGCLIGTPGVARADEAAPEMVRITQLTSQTASTQARDLASSANGDFYVTGYDYPQLSLGVPDPAMRSPFLAKYDRNGAEQWMRWVRYTTDDYFQAATVGSTGDVFVAGQVGGLGAGTREPARDVWVARFSPQGTLLWEARSDSGQHDEALDIITDPAGNSYVTGRTHGAFDGPSRGGADIFLAKYSPTGSRLWVKQFGTSAYDLGRGVGLDGQGNIYLLAEPQGRLGDTHYGSSDLYLAKFDTRGELVWDKQWGGSSVDYTCDLAVDAAGNSYVASRQSIAKYDTDGTQLWAAALDRGLSDWPYAIELDSEGNCYVTSRTSTSLGGPNAGMNDILVVKYDADGARQWITQFGSAGSEYPQGIGVANGRIFIAGPTGGDLGGPHGPATNDTFVAVMTPEPGTLSLLALGALALVRRRRPSGDLQ